MVRTGIMRGFGSRLRHTIASAMRNRMTALLAGLGVTAILQSSTATALIAASCAERGLMGTAAALAVVLGADVGTALVAQALSIRIDWLSPFLIFAGFIAFSTGTSGARRDLGRSAIGIGLILLALHLIVAVSEPMRGSWLLRQVLGALSDEPFLALLIGAILTALAHSSLAMVLLLVPLAAAGAIDAQLAMVLVLGINIGGPIPALLATLRSTAAARRVPLGNLAAKAVLAIVALFVLEPLADLLGGLAASPDRLIVNLHLAFNLALAAIGLPLLAPASKLLERLIPEQPASDDEGVPRYLDAAAIETGTLAIAAAAREALRMGDIVERMLQGTIRVLCQDDRRLVDEISRLDDTVDRLHEAIKLYLIQVSRESLGDADSRRCMETMAFVINLEHIGDIIDKNLMELGQKKLKYGLRFSPEGQEEIRALHAEVMTTMRLSLGVFMSGELALARQLVSEKAQFREMERRAVEHHLQRLKEGRPESIETSALHLDILRDLKRIHSHLAAVAHPILESAGELAESRLRQIARMPGPPDYPPGAEASASPRE